MVQIFRGSADPRNEVYSKLGESLGKSIGNGIQTYRASKALDDVMKDEKNANLPFSEKLALAEQAMRPYGEIGEKFLQNQVSIAAQRQQEQQQAQQRKQNQAFGKLLNGQELSPEENEVLSNDQRMAWAKHQQAVQGQQTKFQQQKELQTQKDEAAKERAGMKAPAGGVKAQPVPEETSKKISQVLKENKSSSADELKAAMDEAGIPPINSDSYVENRRRQDETSAKVGEKKATRESQEFERSYEAQKDFINKTTDTYKGFETEMKPRLLQMRNIPDKDLVSPTASVFLEELGIPLGALENPGSELYNKLSQDLLKGLPETYGSRILKVEVDNFLKTIPTLLNSPDGRRMIASNMLKLGEMKEVYYNEMRRQQKDSLDNQKNLPKDFQQRIFDQVKPQINRINDDFVKMSEVTSVPQGHIPFFSPNGEIEFVPKEHAQWAQENGGRRIW